jgi:hypothetical protein
MKRRDESDMSYFLRLLSPSPKPVSIRPVIERLRARGLTQIGLAYAGDPEHWDRLLIRHGQDGPAIAEIERLPVFPGSPGEQELAQLIRVAEKSKPLSAAAWVSALLPQVQTVWGVGIYVGLNQAPAWEALGHVKDAIWSQVGGIQFIEQEGFSNHEGYQITWAFPPEAEGTWWMALLKDGEWLRFEMDLGNALHRQAFQAGQLPPGCHPV